LWHLVPLYQVRPAHYNFSIVKPYFYLKEISNHLTLLE
jgi:hypothetical protein